MKKLSKQKKMYKSNSIYLFETTVGYCCYTVWKVRKEGELWRCDTGGSKVCFFCCP